MVKSGSILVSALRIAQARNGNGSCEEQFRERLAFYWHAARAINAM